MFLTEILGKWEKDKLAAALRTNVLEVAFVKKDGSGRIMKCTLSEGYLPSWEKSETPRKENDNILSVWDIDNNGWRSFRLDSITSVRIVND